MNTIQAMILANNQTQQPVIIQRPETTQTPINVLIQGDMAKIFSAVVSTNNGYARGGYSPLVT